jgi:hypothetical protein
VTLARELSEVDEANKALTNYGKKPTTKAPVVKNNKPDTTVLKRRIADVRKQVGVAFEEAQRLGATKLAAQIRDLSQQLVELEACLAQSSGVERRLVRLINKI